MYNDRKTDMQLSCAEMKELNVEIFTYISTYYTDKTLLLHINIALV